MKLKFTAKPRLSARPRLERETKARQDFNAALAPHTEALCRRFLREGVRQHERWHVLIGYFDGSFSIDIPLSGPSQGTWRLEALPRGQDGQGALAGLFGKQAVLPVPGQLPGAAQIMWKDRLAGKPGDLLDIVHLSGPARHGGRGEGGRDMPFASVRPRPSARRKPSA